MSNTELNDLEQHLLRKLADAVGDVMQLVDAPTDQAKILVFTLVTLFASTVDLVGEMYEADTGKKADPRGITLMLAKECVSQTKRAHPRETRASKPRKRPARSS